MPPAPTFHKRLGDVLLTAFDLATLQRATDVMNVNLAHEVYTARGFRDVMTDFISWCRRQARLGQFLEAAAGEFPNRNDVLALRVEFAALPPDPSAGSGDVTRFASQFATLLPRFQYVQAYKNLHDILHDLDGLRGQLEKEQAARATAGTPLPLLTVITLKKWKGQAAEWDRQADPETPNKWVPLFQADVDDLLGPDDDDRTRHRFALANLLSLPAKQLNGLNIRLVAAAHRLRMEDMADLLDVRLDALPELARAVTAFRRTSTAFTTLVDVHDLCQNIDTEVRPADEGRSPKAAADWPPWKRVRLWLDQLAALRPDDVVGGEVAAAAERFAAGGGVPAFDEFADAFRVWFFDIDKKLLDGITPLLTSANQLQTALGTPQ